MAKTFLVTGATGLIGSHIIQELLMRNENIIVLSTTHAKDTKARFAGVNQVVSWDDYLSLANEKIDVVINLAGRNVGSKRWTEKFKKELYNSRILTTRKLTVLISRMNNKPDVLINSSGVDYYGAKGSEDIYEDSKPGNDFMAKMCIAWEAEAAKAENSGVRVVLMRTGFVLAREAEAVKRLARPFKFFVGGSIGSGKQYLSWIHIDDIVGIFLYSAYNNNVNGAVNAASPNAETMKNFCREIAKVLHRPAIMPIPSFAVKMVAGEVGQAILNGRKAVPKKILEAGYKFKFNNALPALEDILR